MIFTSKKYYNFIMNSKSNMKRQPKKDDNNSNDNLNPAKKFKAASCHSYK